MWRMLPLLILPFAGCIGEVPEAEAPSLWTLEPFDSSCGQFDCTIGGGHLLVGNRSAETIIGTAEGWLLVPEHVSRSTKISFLRPDGSGIDAVLDSHWWGSDWDWDGQRLWGTLHNETEQLSVTWNLAEQVAAQPFDCGFHHVGWTHGERVVHIEDCFMDGRRADGFWMIHAQDGFARMDGPNEAGIQADGPANRMVAESTGLRVYNEGSHHFIDRGGDHWYRDAMRIDGGFVVVEAEPMWCYGWCFNGSILVLTDDMEIHELASDVPFYSTDGKRVWATQTTFDVHPETYEIENETRTLHAFDGAWRPVLDVSHVDPRWVIWAVGAEQFAYRDWVDGQEVLALESVPT